MTDKISILYVDDEPINLMLFETYFKKNFNVITAESGPSGMEILQSNSTITAVISDMKMPEMNGLEFVGMAKNEFPSIAYFILTGYDITEEITAALNSNLILKYFRKPFDEVEIQKAIKEFIEKIQ